MSEALAVEGGRPVRTSFLPFGVPSIGEEEIAEVVATLRSGWIGQGERVQRFVALIRKVLDPMEDRVIAVLGLAFKAKTDDMREARSAELIPRLIEAGARVRVYDPVAMDNDWQNWRAWGNQVWPGVYLIDKKGFVRYRWDGELNWKDIKGEEAMRRRIEELLAEKD